MTSNTVLNDKIRRHYAKDPPGPSSSEALDLGSNALSRSRGAGNAASLVKRKSETGLKSNMNDIVHDDPNDSSSTSDQDAEQQTTRLKRFSMGNLSLGTSFAQVKDALAQCEGDLDPEEASSSAAGVGSLPAGASSAGKTFGGRKKEEDKKKPDKKQKKLEKMEKEQKKRREEDLRKLAQEEEILETLLAQRRVLEEAQLALVGTDNVEKQVTPLAKKVLTKGTVLIKSAKLLKNNPTNAKAKKEFVDSDKDFGDTVKRLFYELWSGDSSAPSPDGAQPSPSPSLLIPPSSDLGDSPPTSPFASPRGIVEVQNPAFRRSRSATTNATRAPPVPSTPLSVSPPKANARFLSPPRRDPGTSSSLPSVARRNDKETKKNTQKKSEALSKLGELHSLMSLIIESFQLSKMVPSTSSESFEPLHPSHSSSSTPKLSVSGSAIPTSTSQSSSGSNSANSSGTNLSNLAKDANLLMVDPPTSTGGSTGESSPEEEAKKERMARRTSVGRTFGRIMSAKKPDQGASAKGTAITKKELSSSASKAKGVALLAKDSKDGKDTETLKIKKQQENFVMALFLTQRPAKESLIARKIINQSSFGVSLEKLIEGDQKIPTFLTQAFSYLEASGLEGQLFDADESLAKNVEALQASYDSGKHNLFDSSPKVVAGLLVRWFTLLPEPVIPTSLHDDLFAFDQVKEPDEQVFDIVKSLVFKLPSNHRWLLKDLLSFLSLVVRTNANRYTNQSLGAIFGPILFHAPQSNCNAAATLTAYLIARSTPLFQEVEPEVSYIMKGGRLVLKSASLQRLICKVLGPYYGLTDREFLPIFLLTYSYYFTSASELLEILQREYRKRTDDAHLWACKIRERICETVLQWYQSETTLVRGDSNLQQLLRTFSDNPSVHASPEESATMTRISNMCKEITTSAEHLSSATATRVTPQLPTPVLIDVLAMDVTLMAQHITAVDKLLFEKIPLREFLKKNFTKPATSPCYTEMAKRFNQWSQWVCTEIVQQKNIQQRVEVLSKFVSIAKACRDLNNFNTSYAIIAGLDQSAVSRLKQTWEKLPKSAMTTFEELKELFNIQLNHKNYRDALQAASPPLVPYLGLYTKFLLAIEDGNPVKIEGGSQINWARFRKLFKQLEEIRVYQSCNYDFSLEPSLLTALRTLTTLSDEESFKLSLVCEPRATTAPPRRK